MTKSQETQGGNETSQEQPGLLTSLAIERLTEHKLVVEFPEFLTDGAAKIGFLEEMERLTEMFDEQKVFASLFYGADNQLSYGIFVERGPV